MAGEAGLFASLRNFSFLPVSASIRSWNLLYSLSLLSIELQYSSLYWSQNWNIKSEDRSLMKIVDKYICRNFTSNSDIGDTWGFCPSLATLIMFYKQRFRQGLQCFRIISNRSPWIQNLRSNKATKAPSNWVLMKKYG